MTFWGFAMNYMIRMNINIAIVSMIKYSRKSANMTTVSECTSKPDITLVQQFSTELDVNTRFFFFFVERLN